MNKLNRMFSTGTSPVEPFLLRNTKQQGFEELYYNKMISSERK